MFFVILLERTSNMKTFKYYLEKNKNAWNKRTPIHIQSKFYNNLEFKKNKNSLKSIELNEIGDVNQKSILHLQCHFGQDSISLMHMGAKVTGIDFSNVAINEAKKLAKETNTNVTFIEEDILKLNLNKKFDLVFSSYGVIGWLPDLKKWGSIISNHLKKGGEFLLTEFHPFIALLDNEQWDYFYNKTPDIETENGTYTDGGENLTTTTCWWNHSLTNIFVALESNGLKLTSFKEFDYSPFPLKGMIKKEKGKYVLENRKNQKLPYVFSLKAIKK